MDVDLLLFIFLKNFGTDNMTYVFPLLKNLYLMPKKEDKRKLRTLT